jgi:hypothetical protein
MSWLIRLIAVLVPCALGAQAVPPTPALLIHRAIGVLKAQEKSGLKYTYREDLVETKVKNGQALPPVRKTYEHLLLEGEDYRKLVLIDGQPLDARTQKEVDGELRKVQAEREKHLIELNPRARKKSPLGDLGQIEQLFDNKVTGEETVLGRRAWRLESEPKPGYKPDNKQEEEALAAHHVTWFDQQDGTRIKKLDTFFRAANGFAPGTTVDSEYVKVGETWLPDTISIRMDLKVMPGVFARGETRQHFYDYKRLTVDNTTTPE